LNCPTTKFNRVMKKSLIAGFLSLVSTFAWAQDEDISRKHDIQTVFRNGRVGGYGAITNKFTSIRGEFANISEVYGGVFINRRFLLGLGVAATTNYIPVPLEFSEAPANQLSYGYGQAGLVTEWVMGSNKSAHLVFHLFTGAGYTTQYERWTNNSFDWNESHPVYDQNWFFVAEPGVQLEVNLFRWMRFSPGVSYRKAYNSTGRGLTDNDLSDWSYNLTLKFGKF
jgi:hypothetical protein